MKKLRILLIIFSIIVFINFNLGYFNQKVVLNNQFISNFQQIKAKNYNLSTEEDKIILVLQINNRIMFINDSEIEIDVPPQIFEGRTLLPIRWVAEPLGATVLWDGIEKKVTVQLKDVVIELWIGRNLARVNGNYKFIDPDNPKVVPLIIEGRTMLPIRFVAENLGCEVDWNGQCQIITIIYQFFTNDFSISKTITPEKGGIVKLSDGAKVEIPPNTLNKTTNVNIEILTNPPLNTPFLQSVGKTYNITIGDAELNNFVKVTLPLNEAEGHLAITHWNGKYWDILGGTIEGNFITTFLKDLSPISVKKILSISTNFKPEIHGYKFKNIGVNIAINNKYYNCKGGICYGMSVTSAGGIFSYNISSPESQNFYDLPIYWQKYILDTQESQITNIKNIITNLKDVFLDFGTIYDLGLLYNKISYGHPVILHLSKDKFLTEDSILHAVVAYKIEIISNSSIKIYVYDPNFLRNDLFFIISPNILKAGYKLTYDYYDYIESSIDFETLFVLGDIECSKPPEIEANKQDITVYNLTWQPSEPKENDTIMFTARIKNHGQVKSEKFYVSLYIDEKLYDSISITSLKPNSYLDVAFKKWRGSSGEKVIKVQVENYIFIKNLKIGKSSENIKKENEPLWTYYFDSETLYKSVLSKKGEYFAIVTYKSYPSEYYIYFFNLFKKEYLWSYKLEYRVCNIAISDNGEYLVVVAGGRIYLFNKNGNLLWQTPWDDFECVAISGDGDYIAAGSLYHFNLYNKSSNMPIWTNETCRAALNIEISKNGEYIVNDGGIRPGYINFFQRSKNEPIWSFNTNYNYPAIRLSASDNLDYIVADVSELYLLNKSGNLIWSYKINSSNEPSNHVFDFSISGSGNYIIMAGYDDNIYLFNNFSKNPLWIYNESIPNLVDISYDGKYIIALGEKIRFFENKSNIPIWEYDIKGFEVLGERKPLITSDGKYSLICIYPCIDNEYKGKIYIFKNYD